MSHPSANDERIQRALDAFLADPGDERYGRAAAHSQAVPAFWDWSAFGGVRVDGEVVWVEYAAPHAVTQVEDPVHRNTILHAAASAHPALGFLDPVQPPGAEGCPACGGSGLAWTDGVPQDDRLVCFCGGLGWLPPGTRYPAT